jgi:hypothetical protein
MRVNFVGLVAVAAVLAISAPALAAAEEGPSVTLTLKDHKFTPATFTVPANQKVKLTVINQDPATEEFDSHDLKVERIVTPNGKATFAIGPLKPGAYHFMGEFHSATAQGVVTAQ